MYVVVSYSTHGTTMIPTVGSRAPLFKLYNAENESVELKAMRGTPLVLYFYPQDDTETCTKQACDFRDHMEEFANMGVKVLGVSPDNTASHQRFSRKYSLNFTLLSDENQKVCKRYGVWQEKQLFGHRYMGVVRSTFVIDGRGIVRAVFSPVRLKGHIDALRTVLESMR